ncbi:MAG: hypothetical protein IJH45_04615 [Firmicutes bacterium]|nr:hypothetical protein [Bacillota bacterium]
MIANLLFRSSFPALLQSPVNCGTIVMLAGLIIVPMFSLFTKEPDSAMGDDAFPSYDKKAEVSQKRALID